MRTTIKTCLAAAFLVASPPALAELPSLANVEFARMVATVLSVDHLKPRCTGAMSAEVQKQAVGWEAANEASLIRQAIAKLEQQPPSSNVIADARKTVTTKLTQTGPAACEFLKASIVVPESQFARTQPGIIASLGRELGVAPSGNAAVSAATASAKQDSRKRDPKLSAGSETLAKTIEGFGFDMVTGIGIGGMLSFNPTPVVLFRNGDALRDVEGLGFDGGIEAHRRANTRKWTKWRRGGGRLQILGTEGWQNLPFTTLYDKLPADFRLNARYQSIGGGGDVAVGGTNYIAAWSTFDFLKDGRVVRGGGAGGYSAFQNASTAYSSVAADRRGRYRIDGLVLAIAYDDGSKESYIIVTDAKDPSVIWLDGTGYTSKD